MLGLDLDMRCILETALTDQDQDLEVVLVQVQGDALSPRIVSTRPCVSPPSSSISHSTRSLDPGHSGSGQDSVNMQCPVFTHVSVSS